MRLVRTLGVVLTFGIAVSGLPAESGAAQATLGCPATAQAGQQFTIEITVDVGTTPLGAYSITVAYDAAVLTVVSVAGGSTGEFSSKPTTNTPTAAPRTASSHRCRPRSPTTSPKMTCSNSAKRSPTETTSGKGATGTQSVSPRQQGAGSSPPPRARSAGTPRSPRRWSSVPSNLSGATARMRIRFHRRSDG